MIRTFGAQARKTVGGGAVRARTCTTHRCRALHCTHLHAFACFSSPLSCAAVKRREGGVEIWWDSGADELAQNAPGTESSSSKRRCRTHGSCLFLLLAPAVRRYYDRMAAWLFTAATTATYRAASAHACAAYSACCAAAISACSTLWRHGWTWRRTKEFDLDVVARLVMKKGGAQCGGKYRARASLSIRCVNDWFSCICPACRVARGRGR